MLHTINSEYLAPNTESPVASVAPLTRSDLLFCLSLANLVTMVFWSQLFRLADPSLDYYRLRPVDLKLYLYGSLQALAVFAVLTGGFVAILRSVRRSRRRIPAAIMRAGVCLLLIFPARVMLRTATAPEAALQAVTIAFTILALSLLPGGRYGHRMAAFGTAAITVLWPLAIVLPGALLWRVASRAPDEAFAGRATASFLPQRAGQPRLIFIVFDELSNELLYRLHPDRVRTPEFHRLRSEALYTDDAAATSEWTLTAIPSLTTGHVVSAASPRGATGLQLRYTDGRTAEWSNERHLFRLVRDLGSNVGVVGWYHPYCRIFSNVLSGCATEINTDAHTSLRREFVFRNAPLAFLRVGRYSLAGLLGAAANGAAEYRVVAAEQRAQLHRLMKAASEFAADPRFGLVFVHVPVPHLPVATPDGGGNYFDNLNEADTALGQLRRRLEGAGLWDSSAVLVTSDHDLRAPLWENRPMWTREESEFARRRTHSTVPFLLKMPHQTMSFPYRRTVNTALTRDLIVEITRGSLKNAADVAQWMDRWHPGVL